jgi:RNA polymerase sigma-70 factor (ECF subfamily)
VIGPASEAQQRFDRLFESHYEAIFRYCLRRVGAGDAEDCTADVFAVAWRRLGDLPGGETDRAWLFGVAYRVVSNQYRSRRRRSSLATKVVAHTGRADSDGSQPAEDRILAALDQLSAADRELLRISTWDGLTRREIADVLDIKENAVDQRLHRARERLRARYEKLDPRPATAGLEEASP